MKQFSQMGKMAVLFLLALMAGPALGGDVDMKAVYKADRFLKTAARGRFIAGFCHFGLTYRSHAYAKTLSVNDGAGRVIPGQFALLYDFTLSDSTRTQLAFLCDARGNLTSVQVMRSNGVVQKPYLLANASMKLVGEVAYEAMKAKMSEGDRRFFRQLVGRSDAAGLMTFCLKVQQATE